MADRNSNFGININANTSGLNRGLGQAKTGLDRFVNDTTSKFHNMGKVWSAAVNKLANPFVGMVTGGGILLAAKHVADMDMRLLRYKQSARLSTEESIKFNTQLRQQATVSGVATESLLGYANAMQRTGRDSKFVSDNMKLASSIMQATGASGEAVGDAMGKMHEEYKATGPEIEKAMSTLYSVGQSKGSEMSLAEFMPKAEDFVERFKQMNPTGSFKELNDYIATAMFTGNPEAMEGAMRSLHKKTGINVVKALGLQSGAGVLEVANAIKRAFPGDDKDSAAKRVNLELQAFGKSGGAMDKLVNESEDFTKTLKEADPAQMMKDSAEATKTAASAMTRLADMGDRIAASGLGKMMTDFGNAMASIPAEKLNLLVKLGTGAAIGGAGIIGIAKVISMAQGVMGLMGGKAGGHVGLGLGLGASPATPMYVVVVGPGGGLPSVGGAAGKAGAAEGILGSVGTGTLSTIASVALPVMGMVAAGYFAHEAYMNKTAGSTSRENIGAVNLAAAKAAEEKKNWHYQDLSGNGMFAEHPELYAQMQQSGIPMNPALDPTSKVYGPDIGLSSTYSPTTNVQVMIDGKDIPSNKKVVSNNPSPFTFSLADQK